VAFFGGKALLMKELGWGFGGVGNCAWGREVTPLYSWPSLGQSSAGAARLFSVADPSCKVR
jgi:hypothetical protein